jgi:hypothetical protein
MGDLLNQQPANHQAAVRLYVLHSNNKYWHRCLIRGCLFTSSHIDNPTLATSDIDPHRITTSPTYSFRQRYFPSVTGKMAKFFFCFILCNCDAVAHIRFRHLGQFFMEPSDYYDAAIYKVLHFIRGVGLIKG